MGADQPVKTIVLIDGEHYPPVVARALKQLEAQGAKLDLALMVGGSEKLGQMETDMGIPVQAAGDDREAALAAAIERTGATRVIDISDEPVLGYVARCRLASVALSMGAAYVGADFELIPPPRPHLTSLPTVAIIGTGKRSGKTGVAGAVARTYRDAGLNPVVVAMGRGGPPEPQIMDRAADLNPAALYELVAQGRHAASDYIEDALTSGVPTVGAWRAGGGLAGATSFSNYEAAIKEASKLDPGLLVMEGSGSAAPPAYWHSGILVVDVRIDPEHLCGYFGLYRLLLVDLVVLTMCEESIDDSQMAEVERCILRSTLNQPSVVRTIFRPHPLKEISGKKIWFATTAPDQAGDVLKRHLEEKHQTKVVGASHALANRDQLRKDLSGAVGADALVVELKAAAVDVVTKYGIENDQEVVYMDNRPEPAGLAGKSLEAMFLQVANQARERCS